MSRSIALILALATGAVALRPQCRTSLAPRRDFLGAAAAAATTLLPQAAHATGKATQKTLFLRYEKRIAGLGSYFDELEAAISNADWAAVTTACEADTSRKGQDRARVLGADRDGALGEHVLRPQTVGEDSAACSRRPRSSIRYGSTSGASRARGRASA